MKDYQLLDDQGRAFPLSNFLAAHRGYRRDTARFPAGVRNLAAKGLPAEGIAALRAHWEGFDGALLGHHQMEDSFLFPMYRAQEPSLGPELDQLESQHHQLDEHIATISGWLAKLPSPDAVEPTVAAFEALEAAVNQHLDLEEEHVVPLMLANPPMPPGAPGGQGEGPQGHAQGEGPQGHAPPGGDGPPGPPDDVDFAFLGPWLADGLDDATVAALLEVAPPPFKVDFEANRRRYEEQLALWSS